MKPYHSIDVFIRQRIRNGHLFFLYGAVFFGVLLTSALALVYGNIFYLQLGVNVYLPLYLATYLTALLWMRISLKRVPSLVDAVVLRHMLRLHVVLCSILALLAIPIQLSIVEGYAERGTDIPFRILITELIAYAILLGASLLQIMLLWKSDKWPVTISVGDDLEEGSVVQLAG